MKTKIQASLVYLFTILCSQAFGQLNQYGFKRELLEIKGQWHKIILPDEVFKHLSPNLSDIRIIGITKANDTIEAPYILQLAEEKTIQKDAPFHLINQSKNDKGYYFTFEIPDTISVNQINLKFRQENFDWKLAVEGSQNNREWYSIIDNYRILSINNDHTNYQFTTINFPVCRYHYYKLYINSTTQPELLETKVLLNEVTRGNYKLYDILSTQIVEDKQNKQTLIHIDLKSTVPVSMLKLFVKDKIDYYRRITIQYLTDSFKTQQGWKYNYSNLTTGTLNSIERNEFRFNSTVLKNLRIVIENKDNTVLKYDSVLVQGYRHELIARLSDPATYYLMYGNTEATKPNYDIDHFADKIPKILMVINMGEEQIIQKQSVKETAPLFQSKAWLWIIMAFIIILLGFFSFNMMRKK